MADRRSFLKAASAATAIGVAVGEADGVVRLRVRSPRRAAWAKEPGVEVLLPDGENIAHRVPLKHAEDFERSYRDGVPVDIGIYSLDADGKRYFNAAGDGIATEPMRVRVAELSLG